MTCVFYILELGRAKGYYYGCTGNRRRRVRQHVSGEVAFTRRRRPVQLVYYEFHKTPAQARERERAFKRRSVRRKVLLEMIRRFPKDMLLPFASSPRPG